MVDRIVSMPCRHDPCARTQVILIGYRAAYEEAGDFNDRVFAFLKA